MDKVNQPSRDRVTNFIPDPIERLTQDACRLIMRLRDMKPPNPLRMILTFLLMIFGTASFCLAQEDSLFRAVRVKGDVTAYHNENDETARLYTSQSVDDGDKVTTAANSEAVLRLDQKIYLYLAPHTRIHITRLRQGDKGLECQVNLVTGRMLCQLGQSGTAVLELTAGSVLCREHGNLFEAIRKDEQLMVVSYQGAVVANFHGKTKMAKDNEVLKLEHGKFRTKTHHLSSDEQADLQAWKDLLAQISQ